MEPDEGLKINHLDDIVRPLKKEMEENKHLLSLSREENIVVPIGNTGSGKTSLINAICDKTPMMNGRVLEWRKEDDAFITGGGIHSVTSKPRCIDCIRTGKIVDLPGWRYIYIYLCM